MSDHFWEGVILAGVGVLALTIGFARGEMPINFRVDLNRESNPLGFWSIAAFYGFIAVCGIVLAAR